MTSEGVELPFFVAPTKGHHTGTVVPLLKDFVNTDVIIPATHMRRLTKTGYGDVLFEPWRNTPGFVLDDPRYAGASILLAGEAFGNGSSREHAPWALRDGGFRAIVATSFADIFAQNCSMVGLVTARLAKDRLVELGELVTVNPHLQVRVDVTAREVRAGDFVEPFQMSDHIRARLLSGKDLIGTTLGHADAIAGFEARRLSWLPATQSRRPR